MTEPFDNNVLITATGLEKAYGGSRILQQVSVEVLAGHILTIIGPNGSGKTTLLKLLLGLEQPDAGQVLRKNGLRIGYMPQRVAIDPFLPVTVEWFLALSAHGNMYKVMSLADELGIANTLSTPLQSVSGGELQRVLLVRALLNDPQLLVLDEPAQGVDVNGQAMLYDLISKVSKSHHCAVLMVSHDLHLVMSSTDHVICLNHHICCSGHPHSVRDDPAFAALFGDHVAQSLAVYTHHHDHDHA